MDSTISASTRAAAINTTSLWHPRNLSLLAEKRNWKERRPLRRPTSSSTSDQAVCWRTVDATQAHSVHALRNREPANDVMCKWTIQGYATWSRCQWPQSQSAASSVFRAALDQSLNFVAMKVKFNRRQKTKLMRRWRISLANWPEALMTEW